MSDEPNWYDVSKGFRCLEDKMHTQGRIEPGKVEDGVVENRICWCGSILVTDEYQGDEA